MVGSACNENGITMNYTSNAGRLIAKICMGLLSDLDRLNKERINSINKVVSHFFCVQHTQALATKVRQHRKYLAAKKLACGVK